MSLLWAKIDVARQLIRVPGDAPPSALPHIVALANKSCNHAGWRWWDGGIEDWRKNTGKTVSTVLRRSSGAYRRFT